MYPASETDSSQLAEARVEIQEYLGNWLRQPWLVREYTLHLLFIVSLAMLAFKYYNDNMKRQEQEQRVRNAYREARRRYRINPNEQFEAFLQPPLYD